MKTRTPARDLFARTMFAIALFSILSLVGCQYDPFANRYTTTQPKTADLVGRYIFSSQTLTIDTPDSIKQKSSFLELRTDGTFIATNLPPAAARNVTSRDINIFTSLVSGDGMWQIVKAGSIDFGGKNLETAWGVELNCKSAQMLTPQVTGKVPPYGLIFTFGDPDAGTAMIFTREHVVETPKPPNPIADNDFVPLLGLGAALVILLMVIVMALLVGVGGAIGLILCGLAAVLIAFGILSSSMALAFLRRNPLHGLQAFFFQLFAIIGIPCGIAASWMVAFLAHRHWSNTTHLILGGSSGLLAGVLVGLAFNFASHRTLNWIAGKIEARQNRRRKLKHPAPASLNPTPEQKS